MTPAGFLRDVQARNAVLRQLAAAYDRFADLEQVRHAEGDPVEAEGAHRYALALIRAFRAECDDPEPEGRDG